ncbi:DNA-3-methyladenine glycosylase family protein [Desertihabitans aurantiacus]|uniref:DNA-3-methyladenine glycosylase family protein n=1 Tax=Desertihabitans aurantiacus TaxID=2282477 RepID=UPI000DF7A3A9|nr:DNA-3-methyladenine glycosylase [Desertihabitans aurantiacus]
MRPPEPDSPPPPDDGTLDAERFAATLDLVVDADARLAAVVDRFGRPGFWSRPASFATLVLLVLEQQVSLASGKATFDRLRALAGAVTPEAVAPHDLDALRGCGLTRQKAGYVADLARGVLDGTVDWAAVVTGDRDACRRALLAVRGIGPWTADVWLLACRGFPDEWPVGDRALQVGCGEVVGAPGPLTGEALVDVARDWVPHRSTVARLVWHDYLGRRRRAETVVEGLDGL